LEKGREIHLTNYESWRSLRLSYISKDSAPDLQTPINSTCDVSKVSEIWNDGCQRELRVAKIVLIPIELLAISGRARANLHMQRVGQVYFPNGTAWTQLEDQTFHTLLSCAPWKYINLTFCVCNKSSWEKVDSWNFLNELRKRRKNTLSLQCGNFLKLVWLSFISKANKSYERCENGMNIIIHFKNIMFIIKKKLNSFYCNKVMYPSWIMRFHLTCVVTRFFF